jgi:hypothetical protein
MKWLLIAGGILVLLILVVVVIGAALPRDHVATGQVRVKASRTDVWAIITDIDAFPSWPVWVEHSSSDRITFAVDASRPAEQWVVRIADPSLPFGGSWTYDVRDADGGTLLTITERGEVYNPVFRFVSRFVLGHEKTIQTYLSAFERRATERGVESSRGI